MIYLVDLVHHSPAIQCCPRVYNALIVVMKEAVESAAIEVRVAEAPDPTCINVDC